MSCYELFGPEGRAAIGAPFLCVLNAVCKACKKCSEGWNNFGKLQKNLYIVLFGITLAPNN